MTATMRLFRLDDREIQIMLFSITGVISILAAAMLSFVPAGHSTAAAERSINDMVDAGLSQLRTAGERSTTTELPAYADYAATSTEPILAALTGGVSSAAAHDSLDLISIVSAYLMPTSGGWLVYLEAGGNDGAFLRCSEFSADYAAYNGNDAGGWNWGRYDDAATRLVIDTCNKYIGVPVPGVE